VTEVPKLNIDDCFSRLSAGPALPADIAGITCHLSLRDYM